MSTYKCPKCGGINSKYVMCSCTKPAVHPYGNYEVPQTSHYEDVNNCDHQNGRAWR